MNYGLYLSAGGALTGMHRQSVIANNLANVNTVGFKPNFVALKQRLPERLEDPSAAAADPQTLLERLGGGNLLDATQISLRQGALTPTGNDLDLALKGDGFFVVSDGQGTGAEHRRFTRDGRFTLNTRHELVMTASGLRVLGENNRPIRINPDRGQIVIDREGSIRQGGRAVGRLQVTASPDPSDLVKAGGNLLSLKPGARFPARPSSAQVQQGFTEASAVDAVTALTDLMQISRTIGANLKLMQYHDHVIGQAVNTFGRVA